MKRTPVFTYFECEDELKSLAEYSFNAVIRIASIEETLEFIKLENEYQKRCLYFQKLIDENNDKEMASKQKQ